MMDMMGININDSCEPWTEMILGGIKTVETRNTDSLRPYVGKRVGIIRTGSGKATLVGYMTLGEPIVYKDEESFRKDEERHMVGKGSKYDIMDGGVKYGYPIVGAAKTDHRTVTSRGIIARKIWT